MEERVEFIKNAIKGEKVGAISRSSKYVVRGVLKNLKGLSLKKIVEYGPGDGVLTLELLKLLDKDGKMLVVELDNNFVTLLKKIKDPRLTVVEGKIEDVSANLSKYGFENSDLVLSSVPFSFIKKSDRESVVKDTSNSLARGGKFIIFHQYSLLMSSLLKKHFKKVSNTFEPRNIFPCFIMSADK